MRVREIGKDWGKFEVIFSETELHQLHQKSKILGKTTEETLEIFIKVMLN